MAKIKTKLILDDCQGHGRPRLFLVEYLETPSQPLVLSVYSEASEKLPPHLHPKFKHLIMKKASMIRKVSNQARKESAA